ncbi:MAG: hypothetical protein Q9191_003417 [Dirinaria sp. TL-2023a]
MGLKRPACETALSNLPRGTLLSIFTTRQGAPTNNWNHVPKRYVDLVDNPKCSITVDLDGHSLHDVFVLVPWDKIRAIAEDVIGFCVKDLSWGGWETYGLNASFEALMPPSPYDSLSPAAPTGPAVAYNPDGSGGIAIPERTGFREVATMNRKDEIARTATAFTETFVEDLYGDDHPRWWEFSMEPLKPEFEYKCNASFGSPSTSNCEAVLYEFFESGTVVLDPMSGPLIKTSGNCAIGVKTTSKLTTTWEMLRTVAQHLLATCVADPLSGIRGGLATSQPSIRRKRRAGLNAWPSSLTMAAYFQDQFDGAASDTCAWSVVLSQISSHKGDVRQCPAPTGPWRPPERELEANGTESHEWQAGNITIIQHGNWTEIAEDNLTNTITDANLTSDLADLPILSPFPSAESASTPSA